MEYFYHLLAQEFGYSRDYVDKYINAPSFRDLLEYRKDYPPISMLIKGLLIYFGAIEPDSQDDKDQEQLAQDAVSQMGKTAKTGIQLRPAVFNHMLDKIRAPANY